MKKTITFFTLNHFNYNIADQIFVFNFSFEIWNFRLATQSSAGNTKFCNNFILIFCQIHWKIH